MNSLTTQLLKKSKTEEGFNSLNRELQDIRSRQENNYRDYYYHGKWRDKDEFDGDVRKRWERDQELIESFNELFTWDEKFAIEVEYGIGSFDDHKIRSKWEGDRNEFQKDVADTRTYNAVRKMEEDKDSGYEDFKYYDHYNEDDIGLYHRKTRTMLVKVSNFQKIEKGFGG